MERRWRGRWLAGWVCPPWLAGIAGGWLAAWWVAALPARLEATDPRADPLAAAGGGRGEETSLAVHVVGGPPAEVDAAYGRAALGGTAATDISATDFCRRAHSDCAHR